MSEVAKKRAGARGWLTRAKNSLSGILEKKPVDRFALLDAVDEFDKRLQAVDEFQSEYEMEFEEKDLMEVIDEAAVYRESAKVVRVKATELLASFGSDDEDARSIRSSAILKPDVKLPKLVLPSFSGNVLQWQSFWDQFTAVVHSSDLPEISKFAYLRSLLEGEAKEAIQGLSLTEKHYREACKILVNRFGKSEKIIFQHVQELLGMSAFGKQSSLSALRKLQDKLLSHVRSLEGLGITGLQYGVLLTPIVLSCLPADVRMEWARCSEGKESDLEWLLEFMGKEITLRERSQTFKTLSKPVEVKSEEKKSKPTATSLQTSSKERVSCAVCNKNSHHTHKCWELTKSSLEDRKEKILKKGLCFRCLGKGHQAQNCDKVCSKCKGNHCYVLCKDFQSLSGDKNQGKSNSESRSQGAALHCGNVEVSSENSSVKVMMQTALIKVSGRKGTVKAHVVFDTGADRTYVSSQFVQSVCPEFVCSDAVSYGAFGTGKTSRVEQRNVYQLNLQGSEDISVLATEIPVICAPLHCKSVPQELLLSFGQLQFADRYDVNKEVVVDILIGLDWYWQLVKPKAVSIPEGLVAQETVFGWMLSGIMKGTKRPTKSHQLLCMCDLPDSTIRNFWNVEESVDSELESVVLEKFQSELKLQNGRYEIALPWKPGYDSKLVDNYDVARNRLTSLQRKLSRDTDLKDRYNSVLHEMEENQIIEEVPVDQLSSLYPTFYLPHHPVVKESSSSTKVRPVFDASAKGANNVSLNDCMETGPNLVPSLVDILCRFRRWPVAVVADVRKAFLQICVRKEDQDVHRFLWEKDGVVRVMRILRVPFGNRSSPFILNATIKCHLAKFEDSKVIKELRENLYVDDWLSGANNEREAKYMVEEALSVMKQAGMELTKWKSNQSFVVDKSEPSDYVKVLGLGWRSSDDCFTFDGLEFDSTLRLTKRVVLSVIARLFDPLGFLNPFTIGLKCVFQDLWRQGISWDEEIPEVAAEQVQLWLDGLSSLRTWCIPRCYFEGPWANLEALELHAFSDASEKAYGACVYLVSKMQSQTVASLVISKAKVAPLKRVTLPRLELLGALLAASLVKSVRESLQLSESVTYRCWTDSMIVLGWIQGDPTKWKQFVSNRVEQIQELTSPSQWGHCPGKENPADLVTRGISASDLISSKLWLNGPERLFEKQEHSAVEVDHRVFEDEESGSFVHVSETLVCASAPSQGLFEIERWGSLVKSIRVVAWVLRFIRNVKASVSDRKFSELELSEMQQAKNVLIQNVQKQAFSHEIEVLKQGMAVSKKSPLYRCSPFIGEDGLLRVKGRLDQSELTFDAKHPIIIPKCHFAILLVRFQHLLMKHAGVNGMITSLRSAYWIIGLRRIAKSVKRLCVACQKLDATAATQQVAPLPEFRINMASPFSMVGMDHAGPLYCSDFPGKKFYVLLFTCAVVRAIHLELVNSLNVEDCVQAIRRFIARRSLPSIIYSDNAKPFRLLRKG